LFVVFRFLTRITIEALSMGEAVFGSGTLVTHFPCSSCGAKLEFSPAVSVLKCPYCGRKNTLDKQVCQFKELDFYDFFARAAEQGESEEKQTVSCNSCSAVSTVETDISMSSCPFCGSSLTARARSSRLIKPGAVLPFNITRSYAAEEFRKWLSGLWFAPGELKRYVTASGGIRGMYLPYWTYDARVTTQYEGQRGEDYHTAKQYEEKGTNAADVTGLQQVTRTRWNHVRGGVVNTFDDVLVPAGKSLPSEIISSLEPWDLKNLVPYSDEYLSGFQAEAYQLDLGEGFEKAKGIMDSAVRRSVERDIGGNRQQIGVARSQYDNITFKHILLPVWISAYRYRGNSYRFIVNARTGQVRGERPYSIPKIVLIVVVVLFALLLIALLLKN
jgi:predicted RNA-binding Zn-ribbon protein involved in translation (DUF1610 family)